MTDTDYQLSIEDTLKTAWSKVSGSKGTFWAAILISFIIMIGAVIAQGILSSLMPAIKIVFQILANIINFLVTVGLIYIGIMRAKDLPISYEMLFRAFRKTLSLKIICVYILQILIFMIPMLIMFAGVILFPILHASMDQAFAPPLISSIIFIFGLLAMFYLAIRLILSMGYVLDRESGPLEAIKLSFMHTKSNFWNILFITIIQSLFVVISAIPLGIGLIWTIPFALINYGVIYSRLSANHSKV